MHGDLRDPEVVDRLLQGVDVLIHLAGTSVERPLPRSSRTISSGFDEVYEGARRHGVKRIVFASSNHAFGMYSVTDKLSIDAPFRPDGFYGLSKAWGEDMTRMYWDKHGIEGISIRIGSTLERPTEFRHLSTWLGYEDVTQLMMCCIEAHEVGLRCGLGRVEQHAQLLGQQHRRRADRLPSGPERGGLRRRDPAPAQSARSGRAEVPGRELRHDGLHAARTAALFLGEKGT